MTDLLVVEDDPDIVSVLEMVLTERGYRVTVARNGQEGLSRLSEKLPDVLLMDVEMPVLDGPSMAARILIDDAGRENVPIVIMSGATGLAAIASRVGTPYFLAKPCPLDALLSTLSRASRERRAPHPTL